MYGGGELIEATPPRVRTESLVKRAVKPTLVHVDVLRPKEAMNGTDKIALLDLGATYIGHEYASGMLFQLALGAAIKKRTDFNPIVRGIIAWVIDRVISSDSDKLVCTELAYRLYAADKYHVSYRPKMPEVRAPDLPPPAINPFKLLKEVFHLYEAEVLTGTFPSELLVQPKNDGNRWDLPLLEIPKGLDKVSGESLVQKYEKLLAKVIGSTQSNEKNPKTVLLVELRNSPTFNFLGRLKLSRIEDGT